MLLFFFSPSVVSKAPGTFQPDAVTKKQKVSIKSVTNTSTGRKYAR